MAKIEYESYYHIFNRGINGATIFRCETDFNHFLMLYKKYILLIANTFAWILMSNHFHFLVKIKEENEIGFLTPFSASTYSKKWREILPADTSRLGYSQDKLKKPNPSRQFSHLFNAYSKWFNNKYKRSGSLFEKNFNRKEVEDEQYLKHLVYYIHHNPLHHGVSNSYTDYQWTSYNDFVQRRSNLADIETVIAWFDDLDNFVFFHQEEHELSVIQDYL
jgi:REP element-mobilizing transposase RayT